MAETTEPQQTDLAIKPETETTAPTKELPDLDLNDLAPKYDEKVEVIVRLDTGLKQGKLRFLVRKGVSAPIYSEAKKMAGELVTEGNRSFMRFNEDKFYALIWNKIVVEQPDGFAKQVYYFLEDLKTPDSDKKRCKIGHKYMFQILRTVYQAFDEDFDIEEAQEVLRKN